MKSVFRALTLLLVFLNLLTATSAPVFAADVNNFEIQDYQIDYHLGRDGEGRSTLKTIELISALFPASDQNHGIERAIPDSYDGHSTSLKVISVTDAAGAEEHYSTRDSNGNTVLRIGDADTYVHGLQSYKITYTQRDVTQYFKDTNRDEFYWDTNGTGWAVPTKSLTARLHIADSLSGALSNHQQCYQGGAGSTNPCEIRSEGDGFVANAASLKAYANMTIAVGFTPHTFAPYRMTLTERLTGLWIMLLVLTFPVALILIGWISVRYNRRSNRLNEIKVIVPEYLPPKDVSVSTSGSIVNESKRIFSAQLIDFAVRHYIKIYQTRAKSLFKSARYELEIIKDIHGLKGEEQEIFNDVFVDPQVGSRLDMETLKRNTAFGLRLSDNKKKLDASIASHYALRGPNPPQSFWFKRVATIAFIAALVTLSPWLLAASIISLVCTFTLKPLTDKGLELSRYLKGLELYIKMAETD
ncbi:MAG TPA: DUF2207 domain-containing protein, partial [Candidatus Polarisedimenticolaceae bacterium]|nr:DUF2207 domain-containing protein [Candidatus Polarisedimenticolaceae bacterium]